MIPIENIYYLLTYSFRDIHHFPLQQRGAEPFRTIGDLLVHALTVRMERIIKRGLERSYRSTSEAVAGVRGRLDVGGTISRLLLPRARTHCEFDEFDHDVLANRPLKATLRKAMKLPALQESVRNRTRGVLFHLREVSDIDVSTSDFVRLPRRYNNNDYPFALLLARLIQRSLLINVAEGKLRFHDFTTDDHAMARIFEEFLFEFYRTRSTLKVARPHVRWYNVEATERDLGHLPIMRTDVVVQQPGRTLVIDAKYYREALKGWHGTDRVRSGNLYQILAYLDNLQPRAGGNSVEGMLLYPVVQHPFAFDYRINGRCVKIRSVDLNQPWRQIEQDLLTLVS
jgi:5-methylcytosine-specific restriction enzyme subunit McrC